MQTVDDDDHLEDYLELRYVDGPAVADYLYDFDPVDPEEEAAYRRREAMRAAETPKQRLARINREQREARRAQETYDAGRTSLGDILKAAILKSSESK